MKKLDTSRIKTYSLKDRPSKVRIGDFAKPHHPGASFRDFFSSLPNILGAQHLKDVVAALVQARKDQRPVMLGMGAHSIKVGLNPVIIDLMERGIITSLSLNGAGIIHDFELAFVGQTSEDVDKEILSGAFGMAEETGRMLNQAIATASGEEGIGACVGRMIQAGDFPYKDKSLLAAGHRLNVPVTVHVAIGTDIIHMHPSFDGRALGAAAHRDFLAFCALVSELEGGAYISLGSAVLLPEIFSQGRRRLPQPRTSAAALHDREYGLCAALPAKHQRSAPPHPGRRQGLCPDRPSRDHAPPACRCPDRTVLASPYTEPLNSAHPCLNHALRNGPSGRSEESRFPLIDDLVKNHDLLRRRGDTEKCIMKVSGIFSAPLRLSGQIYLCASSR
jgi:hypothetical protein